MDISTKYNIGDSVWFMRKGRIVGALVSGIRFTSEADTCLCDPATANNHTFYDLRSQPQRFSESELYPTPESVGAALVKAATFDAVFPAKHDDDDDDA